MAKVAITYEKDSGFLKNLPANFKVVEGPVNDEEDPVCHIIVEGISEESEDEDLFDILLAIPGCKELEPVD